MTGVVVAGLLFLVGIALGPPGRPARVSALVPAGRRRPPSAAGVGRTVRRAGGRPPDDAADARLGWAVVVSVALVPVDPVLAAAAGGAVWLTPWWRQRAGRAASRRREELSVPEVVDLVRLGVSAGLPVRSALDAAVRRAPGPLADRFAAALRAASRGRPLADALAEIPEVVAARPLVDALVAGERYGAPLGGPLARVADECRMAERRRAEQAARRLPVLLLFPLVFCTLPAFVLVTVVPVLVSTLASTQG